MPPSPSRRPAPRRARLVTLAAATLAVVVVAVLAVSGTLGSRHDDPWEGAAPESLTIATGGTSGIYHGYGVAVGDVLTERHGVPVEIAESGGSVENLQRLADGSAQVAFSAADAVADAVAGRGSFDQPVEVSALARVYDDFVHLVVPAGSSIRSIEDLRGRTVSLGAPGSGTALIAHRLLDVADVPVDRIDVRDLDLGRSIAALGSGDVDAFFWSGGLRTPGLTDLAAQTPIRLVPLGDLVEAMRERHGGGYRHGMVPQGMYGANDEVATLAVPNFLVVPTDMPEPVARTLVATLFDARSQVARTVPAAAHLDRARAIFTEPVGLHPGALRYYRETKQ